MKGRTPVVSQMRTEEDLAPDATHVLSYKHPRV